MKLKHKKNIAKFMKQYRASKGMSQKKLGDKLKIGQARVSLIEKGHSCLTLSAFIRLLELSRSSVHAIIGE